MRLRIRNTTGISHDTEVVAVDGDREIDFMPLGITRISLGDIDADLKLMNVSVTFIRADIDVVANSDALVFDPTPLDFVHRSESYETWRAKLMHEHNYAALRKAGLGRIN